MITIINDKKLLDDIDKYDIILVGTNTYYRMSNGFQYEVANKYPYVKEKNKTIKYGDPKNLGNILEATEEDKPTFILMYITEGYNFRPDKKVDYLSYEALDACLTKVAQKYKDKKIATTLVGGSPFDGNGSKRHIMKLFREIFDGCDVTVYDYKQIRKSEMTLEEYKRYVGIVDRKERQVFYDKVKERKINKKKKIYLNDEKNYS